MALQILTKNSTAEGQMDRQNNRLMMETYKQMDKHTEMTDKHSDRQTDS